MTYSVDPMLPETPDAAAQGVRLLGGLLSVIALSIVAVVLKTADTVDRSRTARPHRHRRHDGPAPKPWTAAMAATTIDASPIQGAAVRRRTAA